MQKNRESPEISGYKIFKEKLVIFSWTNQFLRTLEISEICSCILYTFQFSQGKTRAFIKTANIVVSITNQSLQNNIYYDLRKYEFNP